MPERGQERSEELEEVLGRMPGWPVRWGSVILFSLVIGLFAFSWTVRSPRTSEGKAILLGRGEPIHLSADLNGVIGKKWKKDGESVEAGEKLLFLSSERRLEAVEEGKEVLEDRIEALKRKQEPLPLPPSKKLHVEKLQTAFEKAKRALMDHRASLSQEVEKKTHRLEERLGSLRELLRTSKKQEKAARKELERIKKDHRIDKKLSKKKVLSPKALRSIEQRLFREKQEFQEAKRGRQQVRLRILELQQEKKELNRKIEEERSKTRKKALLAAEAFLARARTWKEERTLHAPSNGELTEIPSLVKGKRVEKGERLLAVIPGKKKDFARAFIPEKGMGGVKKGKEVRLRLHGYPSEKYGVLKGKVTQCSKLPIDGKYRIRIALTNGLISSYGIRLKPGIRNAATAEFVTHKQRLLERILFP